MPCKQKVRRTSAKDHSPCGQMMTSMRRACKAGKPALKQTTRLHIALPLSCTTYSAYCQPRPSGIESCHWSCCRCCTCRCCGSCSPCHCRVVQCRKCGQACEGKHHNLLPSTPPPATSGATCQAAVRLHDLPPAPAPAQPHGGPSASSAVHAWHRQPPPTCPGSAWRVQPMPPSHAPSSASRCGWAAAPPAPCINAQQRGQKGLSSGRESGSRRRQRQKPCCAGQLAPQCWQQAKLPSRPDHLHMACPGGNRRPSSTRWSLSRSTTPSMGAVGCVTRKSARSRAGRAGQCRGPSAADRRGHSTVLCLPAPCTRPAHRLGGSKQY